MPRKNRGGTKGIIQTGTTEYQSSLTDPKKSPKEKRHYYNSPQNDEKIRGKLNEIFKTYGDKIAPEDVEYIKMAIDKIYGLGMPSSRIYDKYYGKNVSSSAKINTVNYSIKKITTKYPDIFRPLKDIGVDKIVKTLESITLNEKATDANRIRSAKVILDTISGAEKMAKDRQVESISFDTVIDNKSILEIIGDMRAKALPTKAVEAIDAEIIESPAPSVEDTEATSESEI